MLFLLSPAKKLDYDSPLAHNYPASQPLFVPQAQALIEVLKQKSQDEIAQLMSLSEQLAALNVSRYQDWEPHFDQSNSRQALLAFDGDVYDGLQAKTLTPEQVNWANDRLRILSGLYGVLRPLDLMRPYRLEMGTRLATDQDKNLYEFWGNLLTDYLNQEIEEHGHHWVVNLASQEYIKSIQPKQLKVPMVQCVFKENRQGTYKIISFSAKRARGLMCRFAIEQGIDYIDGLKDFNQEGYQYDKASSSDDTLMFLREQPSKA